MQVVTVPYKPRDLFKPYHTRKERWSKIVAHRRFGKTVGTVNDLIRRAALNDRKFPPPRYGYIAPTYRQAKDVAWSYLKHYTSGIPGVEQKESELTVVLPTGQTVKLYGADNYDAMRGLYFDGVVIDEPADIDPRAWPEVIRPTLSDYAGWATFVGTPKGRGWFYHVGRDEAGKLLPEWFHLTLRASETGVLAKTELEDARKTLTAEQYEQEYECSFDAAVIGAYYGRQMADAEREKRICGVPYDPSVRVWTAWDLGMDDATSIWFMQGVGREIHAIDYYEATGMDLAHYAQVIQRRPYVYGGHILPHDVKARELGTGKSREEVLRSLGLDITIAKDHRVDDGINAVRLLLPRMWFDAEKCARGIDALKLYRADYDEKNQVLKPKPVHDWTSHPADSLRYFAMGSEGLSGSPAARVPTWNPRKVA
jgi:phage terminase large subunit